MLNIKHFSKKCQELNTFKRCNDHRLDYFPLQCPITGFYPIRSDLRGFVPAQMLAIHNLVLKNQYLFQKGL